MSNNPPIPVVCAVIERAGRVLIARRPAHKHLPHAWEFPGGKVEPDEAAEAALVREIREELGCDIVVDRALPRFVHDYGAVIIEMIPFTARLAAGSAEPAVTEHTALVWVEPAGLARYALAPADGPVVASYLGARVAGPP